MKISLQEFHETYPMCSKWHKWLKKRVGDKETEMSIDWWIEIIFTRSRKHINELYNFLVDSGIWFPNDYVEVEEIKNTNQKSQKVFLKKVLKEAF